MRFDPDKFRYFFDLLPRTTFQASKLGKKTTLNRERISLDFNSNHKLRHAIEIRHDSFLNPWFIEILKEYEIALVIADSAGKWPYMENITTDFLYLRLHGDSELYASGYNDATLDFWARRIKLWTHGKQPLNHLTITDDKSPYKELDAYVYFDNDAKVRAPKDAQSLIHKLQSGP